jgi:hypothetical protein
MDPCRTFFVKPRLARTVSFRFRMSGEIWRREFRKNLHCDQCKRHYTTLIKIYKPTLPSQNCVRGVMQSCLIHHADIRTGGILMDALSGGLAVAALGLAAFGPAAANAAYLYNNINVTSGGTASASTSDNGPLGNSFSTGPSGFTFTAVDLLVLANSPSDGGTFTVSLLNDNSLNPGSTIATETFADSAFSTSLSAFSAPFSNISLAADTRYWIELSTSTGSLEWAYSAINNGIGVANEYNYYAGSVSQNSAFTPYQMSIGSAVPEASTWALMLTGFAGLGLAGWRASRKAAPAA